jgi:hypothetical protein
MTFDAEVAYIDAAGEDDSPAVKYKGIAILGSHPATVAMAPFNDPEYLIYACSPHNVEKRTLPRVDQWYEIHVPAAHKTRGPQYIEAVKKMPFVWMRDTAAMPEFVGARLYPEAELKAEFGPFTFTSSIAFMLAKAIKDCEELGISEIGLWGIMQASPNEYAYQRPGIQNLIWQAAQRGIKVLAPDVSKLFEPPPEDF